MSSVPGVKSVICEEVFDDRSQPSEEEVRDYALQIGIDPESEPHLLHLARDGLMKPLPKYWKPVYDHDVKRWYYFNFNTKQTSWEHPLDSKFRQLVKKNRSESASSAGEDDSKTSAKEELKSFEEAAAVSLQSDNFEDSCMKNANREMESYLQWSRPKSAVGLRSSAPLVPLQKSVYNSASKPLEPKSDQPSLLFKHQSPAPDNVPKPLIKSEKMSQKPLSSLTSKGASLFKSKQLFEDLEFEDSSSFLDDTDIFGGMKNMKYKDEVGIQETSHSVLEVPLGRSIGVRSSSSGTSVIGRFTVDKVSKIDIDRQIQRLDSDQKNLSLDRHTKPGHGKPEFKLSGGGSVFLKSNRKKSLTPLADDEQETPQQGTETGLSPFDNRSDASALFALGDFEQDEEDISVKNNPRGNELKGNSPDGDEHNPLKPSSVTRSILRTPQGERQLWDMDPQQMSSTEKAIWKQQELEEEKKSVRFNLDRELNISFKLSPSSDDESCSEGIQEEEDVAGWNTDDDDDDDEDDDNDDDDNDNDNNNDGDNGASSAVAENKSLKFAKHPGVCIVGGRGVRNIPSNNSEDGGKDTGKVKKMSPLEEWARETWFMKDTVSKKPSDHLSDSISNIFRDTSPLKIDDMASSNEESPSKEYINREGDVKTSNPVTVRRENSNEEFESQKGVFSDDKYAHAGPLHVEKISSKSPDEIMSNGSLGPRQLGLPLSLDIELANAIGSGVSSPETRKKSLKLGYDLEESPEHTTGGAVSNQHFEDAGNADNVSALLTSVNKKLKGILDSGEGPTTRHAREREQALRDWNVTQDVQDKPFRPPLSRQQSQQQLQQLQQRVHQQDRTAERDRALRDWNVTGRTSELDVFLSDKKEQFPVKHQSDENSLHQNSSLLSKEVVERGTDVLSIDSVLMKADQGSEKKHTPEGAHMCDTREEPEENPHSDKRDPGSNQEEALHWLHPLKNQDLHAVEHSEYHVEEKYNELLRKLDESQRDMLERRVAELKCKLEKEEHEMVELLQQEMLERQERHKKEAKEQAARLEREAESRLQQLREQLEHKQKCAMSELQELHQQALAAQEVENQASMLRVREQHAADIRILREQMQREEEQVRREHVEKLANIRDDPDGRRSKEATENSRALEKLRCEKRLVEDKYRTLKEKYVKLKGEVKGALERKEMREKGEQRDQRERDKKEQQRHGEETSISHSQSHTERSSGTESKPKTTSSTITSSGLGFQLQQFPLLATNKLQRSEPPQPPLDPPSPAPDNGINARILGDNNNSMFNNDNQTMNTGISAKSTAGVEQKNALNRNSNGNSDGNGHVASQVMWWNSAQLKSKPSTDAEHQSWKYHRQQRQHHHKQADDLTPLEALRRQLRTLDELEEQFPASSLTDTYLPYPFSDSGLSLELGSAELEFIRHRIHLERDLVRQAKNSLRAQQSTYQSRLHDFKQRQSSSQVTPSVTLHQMTKEEQELAEMEASMQRTRSLLSEKIVRLRHLENSLRHVTAAAPPRKAQNITHIMHSMTPSGTPDARWTDKVTSDTLGKPQRRWDWKVGGGLAGADDISDEMSSDSGGSSGFSSTEHASDSTLASLINRTGTKSAWTDDALDINTSLYNLNAEISEIWDVLCRQRAAAGLGPPPLLSSQPTTWLDLPPPVYRPSGPYGAVTSARTSAPVVTTTAPQAHPSNSSLAERTNSLRQWLQKAKVNAALSHPEPPLHLQQQVSL